MFALRAPAFLGFPPASAARSAIVDMLEDPFFDDVSTFDFAPVAYRPVNRRARLSAPARPSPSAGTSSPKKRRADDTIDLTEAAKQTETDYTPERTPNPQRDQQTIERPHKKAAALPESFQSPLQVELKEEDRRLVVTAHLQGVPQDRIELSAENGQLRLAATRLLERKDSRSAMRYQETLQRAFSLPTGVDESQITATMRDGVLRVVVPKPEATSSRNGKRIPITSVAKTTSADTSNASAAPSESSATPAPAESNNNATNTNA